MSHVFTVRWHQQSAVMEAMQQLFEKLTSAEGRLDQGKLSEHKSDIAAVRPLLALMRRHLACWFHSPRWCLM
jgi:hypothetical protein